MGKYDPLSGHLRKLGLDRVPMKFEEIEAVLGFALPPSSRRHRAWWSNNPSNNVMTHAWLEAGYRTEDVDLERRRLVFRRIGAEGEGRLSSGGPASSVAEASGAAHPLYGCLRGTVTFVGGVDLTEPADPDWGAHEYEHEDAAR